MTDQHQYDKKAEIIPIKTKSYIASPECSSYFHMENLILPILIVAQHITRFQNTWSCPKHLQRHLVHTKTLLILGPMQTSTETFGSCQKSLNSVLEHIWSIPNGPWYLVLLKTSILRMWIMKKNVNKILTS